MPYRILSFDGGGIRGYFTCRVLQRLLAAEPGLIARTDLLAGTSTGGIIALGLAAGFDPTTLAAIYRDNGPAIFDDGWLPFSLDLNGIAGADYDNVKLKKLLQKQFGKLRLRDLGKRVLVPAYDLKDPAATMDGVTVAAGKPKFFHNFPGPDSDGAELAVDVAMRTSAAPTYFPSYQGYIDGGVHANNPCMAALAQAMHPKTGGQRLEDCVLLSLGTIVQPSYIDGDNLDWGLGQWAKPIVNILMDGAQENASYQCQQMLDNRFRRVNAVNTGKRMAMDDVSDAAFTRQEDLAQAVDVAAVARWLVDTGW